MNEESMFEKGIVNIKIANFIKREKKSTKQKILTDRSTKLNFPERFLEKRLVYQPKYTINEDYNMLNNIDLPVSTVRSPIIAEPAPFLYKH